ncbi:MAG: hypothetical protein C5B52_03905 [Bacteroidetes bacterium]|nr:MAG: hypothetical protein C5B52_03905 [Bacteroidota bacterium]
MLIFETERIRVQRFSLADEENFFRFNSDPEVMKFIRPPLSRQKAQSFLIENIDYYSLNPQFGRWAMFEKNTDYFLGTFMLKHSVHLNDIELGYALFTAYWGRGLGTESVAGGLKYAFDELGLNTVIALTFPENVPSQKVLTKAGFSFVQEFWEEGQMLHLFRKSRKT